MRMRRRRFELAAWEVYECGKQWREADADVAEAIDFCEYYAIEMLKLGAPQHRDVPGEDNRYFYEPRGVAVVIAPWNFPLAILTGMATAALVAGNTVILKPAEQTGIIGSIAMIARRTAPVSATGSPLVRTASVLPNDDWRNGRYMVGSAVRLVGLLRTLPTTPTTVIHGAFGFGGPIWICAPSAFPLGQ